MSITVTLPDGSKKSFDTLITPFDVATSISEGLARATVAAKIDGVVVDITRPLTQDCAVELIKFDSKEGKEVFWHSSAHMLAQAVLRLFPNAKPTIGPPLEDGFYYDFANLLLKQEDLEALEAEMKKIAQENLSVERIEYASKQEAKEAFSHNHFKQEIIDEAEGGLSAYSQGEFVDLCRGPHLPRTGMVKAVWLHKLSGAYWRADAHNEQLTRIYGVTFPDKKLLAAHKEQVEQARKRDHRVLGRRLDLFGFDEVSPGSPFFYPKGTIVYNQLLSFLRKEYKKRGYEEVITPLIYDKALWEQSGHWDHYRENMFLITEGEHTASLKPMNCPSHCLVFNRTQYSYRDLPVRIADFAPLHRNELRGTLGGLTRVRKFSQDDAHIFCREDQIKSEISELIDFTNYLYHDVFKMEFDHVELSTRPEKFLGEEKTWNVAEQALQEALTDAQVDFVVNEGDGAFYGPKIDFHIKDALNRTWQTATIQLDFNLPERFSCQYLGEDSKKHPTVMIHRALLGSIERFFGVLVEHYAGKLPLWLSPVQVRVLGIADRHGEYAERVVQSLKDVGVRAETDVRSETLNKKVREAQLDYVPYILVVGDKEAEQGLVAVRTRDNVDHGTQPLDTFVSSVTEAITRKE